MSLKPKKNQRILYSKETLKEALAAINAGMPINTASNKYNIPRSTLHNKKTAKYADKRPGPDTVLTAAEENTLVEWIFNCSKHGMPVGKQHLLNSVALLVKLLNRENPFANGRPGRHWYQSFLRRHNTVANKISENTSLARAAASEKSIKKWFSNVKSYLEKKKLLNIDPSRIFTTETATLLSPEASDDKENLYVQVIGNAAGQLASTMVLFTCQRIPGTFKYDSLPNGWICIKSENGFMASDNFYDYMTNGFKLWLDENKIELPVVLFLDGRVPHLTLTLTDFCLRNKIELVALHPNSALLHQPLEIALFPSLKIAWREALNNYLSETKAVNLLNESVPPLLKTVFDSLNVQEMLIEGFKVCGLCPFVENTNIYCKLPKKAVEKLPIQHIEFVPYVSDNTSPDEMLESQPNVEKTITHSQFLNYMEETLDSETLQSFKNVNEKEEWTGKIENTSLFYFWRKIVNLCKTEINNFKLEQNSTDEDHQMNENVIEDVDQNSNDDKQNTDFISTDPLKLCVIEFKEEMID